MIFSKEETTLARQLHELGVRKQINYGDWYFYNNNEKPTLFLFTRRDVNECRYEGTIPLWQIHDCLEWLKERCNHHVFLAHDVDDESEWWFWFDEYHETQQYDSGKTPLEALLKTMVAIKKEGK